jgi:hypothetical protein
MGALLAAIGGNLGEALGRKVELRMAGQVGGGYAAHAARMIDELLGAAGRGIGCGFTQKVTSAARPTGTSRP